MYMMLWMEQQREREGGYTCKRKRTVDGDGGATLDVMDDGATDDEQKTAGGKQKQTWELVSWNE